jgi:hypothetical protein
VRRGVRARFRILVIVAVVGVLLFGNFTGAQADPRDELVAEPTADPTAWNTETVTLAPREGECDEPVCRTESIAASDSCALGVMTPRLGGTVEDPFVRTEGRVDCTFVAAEISVKIDLFLREAGGDVVRGSRSRTDVWQPSVITPITAFCEEGTGDFWYAIATATVRRAGAPGPQQWSTRSSDTAIWCPHPDLDPPPPNPTTTTTRPCPNPPHCHPE